MPKMWKSACKVPVNTGNEFQVKKHYSLIFYSLREKITALKYKKKLEVSICIISSQTIFCDIQVAK